MEAAIQLPPPTKKKKFKIKLAGEVLQHFNEQCDVDKRKLQQPLPTNGCFSGCTVLVLSKYATTL
jgi:hypothetical protein